MILQWAARKAAAAKPGIGAAQTVRTWVRKADGDAGRRPGAARRTRLVQLSDASSQYTSLACAARLIEAGTGASIGSVGVALDNAHGIAAGHRVRVACSSPASTSVAHGSEVPLVF